MRKSFQSVVIALVLAVFAGHQMACACSVSNIEIVSALPDKHEKTLHSEHCHSSEEQQDQNCAPYLHDFISSTQAGHDAPYLGAFGQDQSPALSFAEHKIPPPEIISERGLLYRAHAPPSLSPIALKDRILN